MARPSKRSGSRSSSNRLTRFRPPDARRSPSGPENPVPAFAGGGVFRFTPKNFAQVSVPSALHPLFRFLRVVLLCGPFVFCCFSGLLAVSRRNARPSLTAQARGSDDSGSNELGRTRRSWRRWRTRGTPFATFTRIREWSRPAILSHRKRARPPAHSGRLRATQVTSGCLRAKKAPIFRP